VNRRLAALIAAAVVALVTGAVVGGSAGEDPEAAAKPTVTPAATATARTRQLPLRRLAGAVVVMRFAGAPEPAYVRRALKAGRAAGVILFKDNLPTAKATRAMTRRLQRAAGGPPALIATDQEGGSIRNLSWAGPRVAQPGVPTATAALETARSAANDLRENGVNVNLAPVADLGGPGDVMHSRAFPGGPATVARITAASVRGYASTGVAPTAKHFPGLGAATANTDDTQVDVDRPARVIGASDLPPFKAAIAAGVPLVMLSHARYPSLDPGAIASQSREIVTGLLKRRLGFKGVAVTDSIEAQAVRSRMGPGRAAVRSIRAGIDLVLTTGPGSHLRVWRALQAEARRDPRFRARLTDAAARVGALRRSLASGAG
jgi:beta-N-acetylhexosaminidase